MTPPSSSVPAPGPVLRVVLASSEREYYGGERQLMLLARGLACRGHRVAVLARRDGELQTRAAAAGLACEGFAPGHGPLRLWRTRRRLHAFRPDVLHCNDARAMTSVAAAAVGAAGPARVVSRRVEFRVRSPLAYRCLAHRILCVSDAVRARCLAAGIAPGLLEIVPDGVDTVGLCSGDAEAARRRLGLDVEARLLLVVAALQPVKGHLVLLEALAPLLADDDRWQVALAGSGPARSRIEAAAQRLGISGRVRLLGYRDDVPDLLAAASLFVMPSLREGLGSALIEAALAGVPAVATATGGAPGLLQGDGPAAGWLVPAGDAPRLRAAIREAMRDPTEARARAERARARARLLTADAMVEGTLAAYRRLLAERDRAARG